MTVRREIHTAKPRAPATRAELRKRVDERRRVAASIFHTTLSSVVFFVLDGDGASGGNEGEACGTSGKPLMKRGALLKKKIWENDDDARFWAPLNQNLQGTRAHRHPTDLACVEL